jgi:putative membrane protein
VIRPALLPHALRERRRRARRLAARTAALDAAALRRLILRDHLALERTRLANERTVLAYVRTAFALLAGALTLAHLYETPAGRLSAGILAAAGLLLFAVGAWRFGASESRTQAYALRGDPLDDDALGDRAPAPPGSDLPAAPSSALLPPP